MARSYEADFIREMPRHNIRVVSCDLQYNNHSISLVISKRYYQFSDSKLAIFNKIILSEGLYHMKLTESDEV